MPVVDFGGIGITDVANGVLPADVAVLGQVPVVFSVKAFGAAGNVVTHADGAITASGTTFTSASAPFAAGDVGKGIVVQGAGAAGASLVTTISAFTNSSTVTLTAAAGTTVTAATYYYGTDDSAAFAACATAVASAGGGIGWVPAGQFMAAGIPLENALFWQGAGFDASKVYLTPGISTSMFVAPSGSLNSSAIRDLGLYGDGTPTSTQANTGGGIFVSIGSTSTRTCVDLSAASLAEQLYLEDCFYRDFGVHYHGSGNDRMVNWVTNRVWNCATGCLLQQNHPIFLAGEIRYCGTGVSDGGNGIVDISFVDTSFVYCNIGVDMPTGAINSGGRNIFNNASFFGCVSIGVRVSNQACFSSCQFNGFAGGTAYLAQVVGQGNSFVGNLFAGGHTTAAIGWINTGAANLAGLTIEGNEFYADSVSSGATGTVVVNVPGADGFVLEGNHFTMTVDQSALAVNNASELIHPNIDGNNVTYTNGTAGTKALFSYTQDGGGYHFCNNTVFGQNGANSGPALNAGFSYRSIITGNRFRNVASPVLTLGTTDADTRIRDNFGYVTTTQGTATIAAATTSITVTHGLARTPSIAGIRAIAQASPGGDLWISGVTSTQFTINISAAPGSNLAVSWNADAVIG